MAFGAGFGIHRAVTGRADGKDAARTADGQGLVVLLGHIGIAITAIVLITVAAKVAAEWSGRDQEIGRSRRPLFQRLRGRQDGRGSLPAPIEALTETLWRLRARNSELAAAIEDEELTGPSPEELDALRARIRGAIDHGLVTLRKAVLQELVAEVRIESRRVIRPTPPSRGS
jgi:hypothetical protein